jgi:hypothetical protein
MKYIIRKATFSFGVFCLLFSLLNNSAYAYTLGTPHWVERPNTSGYVLSLLTYCDYDINGNPINCTPPSCDSRTIDAFSAFMPQYPYISSDFYSDSSCTNTIPNLSGSHTWLYNKEAVCPAGEVMTGTRFYEYRQHVDDEHQDARCQSISGLTFGASRWVIPANSGATLAPGYKYAQCASNEVMTGISMWGKQQNLDDEHINAYCTKVTGLLSGGTYSWVSAPNAYDTLWGGYKTALCDAGSIMVGARWYEWRDEVDDEHTDVYCYKPPTVSVNVWFSSLIRRVLNYI